MLFAPQSVRAADPYQFCLEYPDGIHDDQSPVVGGSCISDSDCALYQYDAGPSGADCPAGVNEDCQYDLWEDLQRNDGIPWKLHRVYVSASDLGNGTDFTGYTDANGCFVVSGESWTSWDILVYPLYYAGSNGLFFDVKDCPQDMSNCYLDSALFSAVKPGTQVTKLEVPNNDSFSVFAAAAHTMERNVSGINAGTSDFIDLQIRIDGAGVITNKASTGWLSGQTTIFLSNNAARPKITVAHEMGHGTGWRSSV